MQKLIFSSDFINSNGFIFYVDSTLSNYISINYPTTNNIVWEVTMKLDPGRLNIYTPYSFQCDYTNTSGFPCLSFNPVQDIPSSIIVAKEGTSPEDIAKFLAPYWVYNTTSSGIYTIQYNNKLSLASDIGTILYNKDYYQANSPYTASLNPRFLSGREPIDTQFPKVNDPWFIQSGDQIRFENNEDKVFTIISSNIEWDTDIQRDVLTITLNDDVPQNITLDFFPYKRWKENRK